MNVPAKEDIQNLAKAYCEKYSSAERANDTTDFHIFENASDLVRDDPNSALVFILQALAEKPSDFAFANLAAGPLEDLLVLHGETIIDKVEAEAKSNSDFDDLLGGVLLGRMKTHIADRVARARSAIWKD